MDILTIILLSLAIIFALSGSILFFVQKKIFYTYSSFLVFIFSSILLIEHGIHFSVPPFISSLETRIFFIGICSLLGFVVTFWTKDSIYAIVSNLLSLIILISCFFTTFAFSQTFPPALQSKWFLPHVFIYIFSYALLGISFVLSILSFFKKDYSFQFIINKIGFLGLLLGMLFGALWAKEIWGNFWTWDVKETFALLTCICYAIALKNNANEKFHIFNILGFLFILFTWFGVQYIPATQNLHIYG